MFFRRRNYRRRGYKKRGAKRSRVSKSVRKYVKRVIHRNIENKQRIVFGDNQQWLNNAGNSWSIPLIPTLQQGTGDYQITANECKCVKGTLKISTFVGTSSVFPACVRLLVVKTLNQNSQSGSLPATNNILKTDNGVSSLTLSVRDQSMPINNDAYRVLMDKKFIIGAAAVGTGSGVADNSPYCKHTTINYGKWLKKSLKFQDPTATSLCTNDNLYLLMIASAANGSATSLNPMSYSFVNHFKYEDA